MSTASILNNSLTPRPPRDRSRVVCKRCHARKVKCDLSKKLYGSAVAICTNCEKRAEHCQRRDHVRGRLSTAYTSLSSTASSTGISHATEAEHSTPLTSTGPPVLTQPSSLPSININNDQPRLPPQPPPPPPQQQQQQQQQQPYPAVPRSVDRGYVGEYSFLSNDGPLFSDAAASLGQASRSIETRILAISGFDQLPSKSNVDAAATAYFEYLYHTIPVLDRQDVSSPTPSALILHAVCFIGSLLRHPKSARSLLETEEVYTRAKLLFFLNHEHEPLSILKAMCLFTLWNVRPPSAVTMDCSWNWLGMALRIAIQMGLHRESTYLQTVTPKCARRIAWFLYSQDKMQAACFDRPPMLKAEDFDLRPLSVHDFEEADQEYALLFILIVDLAKILSRLLELRHVHTTTRSHSVDHEALSVLESMREWVQKIPARFRTFDLQGNIIYNRAFYGVLSCYLTLVITFFHICRKNFQQSSVLRVSLVASSCMVGIYREMDYRDHINYLPVIHNWYMAAAVLTQLNHLSVEVHGMNASSSSSSCCSSSSSASSSSSPAGKAGPVVDDSSTSKEELETILEMLRQRTLKYPGGIAVVNQAEKLKHEILSAAAQGRNSSSLVPHGFGVMNNPTPTSTNMGTNPCAAISRVYEFFPFPKALSPRIALLNGVEVENRALLTAHNTVSAVWDEYPGWTMETLLGLKFPDFS